MGGEVGVGDRLAPAPRAAGRRKLRSQRSCGSTCSATCGSAARGQPVTAVNTNRLHSLIAYLILHGDTPQPREQLAFVLWPASSESQARTNLRQLLHHLKRALPAECNLLVTDHLRGSVAAGRLLRYRRRRVPGRDRGGRFRAREKRSRRERSSRSQPRRNSMKTTFCPPSTTIGSRRSATITASDLRRAAPARHAVRRAEGIRGGNSMRRAPGGAGSR